MNANKPIVKQTIDKRVDLRPASDAGCGAPGGRTKVGEEIHIEVTPERIRVRAYEIYQARNGAPGDEVCDWCQAEAELNGRAAPGSAGEAPADAPDEPEISVRPAAQRQSARGGL